MKICTSCHMERPLSEFYKWKKSSDGHHYCCKHCHKKRRQELKDNRKQNVVVPLSKLCISCNETKSSTEFWRNVSQPDGLTTYCKSCGSNKQKATVYQYVIANKQFIDWTGTKLCAGCNEDKDKTDFYKHLYHKDGLSTTCKSCTHISEYTDSKLLQKMVTRARKRARDKDIPFDIDSEYIKEIMTERCPMLNVPLINPTVDGDNHNTKDNSPSIDRIDNSGGYTKGNVVVISHKANRIKNNATLEELEGIVNFLQTHQQIC